MLSMFNERFKPFFRHEADGSVVETDELPPELQDPITVEGQERAHARAVEIAGEGNYARILSTLSAEDLLSDERERVVEEYKLDELSFVNEHDKDMFTVLDLYDPGTARHCLETYKIAKDKIEKEIVPGVTLARLIERDEGISLDAFYRACLFHDIGKVEVPRVVVRNRTDDGHMLECLHHIYPALYHEGRIPKQWHLGRHPSDMSIDETLHSKHKRPIELVPAKKVLSPEDLEEVQRFGYTGEETLMDMLRPHERLSGKILAEADYPVEAKIAALHHNYDDIEVENGYAIGALHLGVDDVELTDMLHIADVSQALQSTERPYKRMFREPRKMKIIVEHAEEERVKPFAAYLWLKDDLKKYESLPKQDLSEAEQKEDEHCLSDVRAFIAYMENEFEQPIAP